MAEIEKKPVKIVETILRDAHQSLIATRMTTEQMMPIVEKMDKVGYHAVECWGGATFDASLRFLKEDPWERLRKFRDGFKNTKLQMLFRGQNILGYRPYADDVVEYFVQKSVSCCAARAPHPCGKTAQAPAESRRNNPPAPVWCARRPKVPAAWRNSSFPQSRISSPCARRQIRWSGCTSRGRCASSRAGGRRVSWSGPVPAGGQTRSQSHKAPTS